MLESLIDIDKKLFLTLNHFSCSGLDPVMRFLSSPVPWIIFFIGLVIVFWRFTPIAETKQYLIIVASLILAYVISEQASVHLFKEVFMRLRPCHEPELAGQVRLVAHGCGGQYGFVSTHAANSFCLAVLSALLIKRKWFTISVFAWAILVSYSRIYVGVHYPGDVLGGAALGSLIGTASFLVTRKVLKRGNFKDVQPPSV